ncbi:MAG: alkaline phosphatase family protein [Desulfobulbaceae bacterium]|nr:alkaline phosphatase family protein [Desulfobulbaceae bacterium]
MQRTVVLNVVGLTRSLLHQGIMPNLEQFLPACLPVATITPAVTCSVQATYLTGTMPSVHGIVGNGWYCRELSEVLFWKQSNRLIQADKIWHLGRSRNRSFTCANSFWWFNMATDTDWAVTPRPVYCADGRKLPDCYTNPAGIRDHFNREFGQFPLFRFWGPGSSIASSEWIGKAAQAIEEKYKPVLHLVYLPHLDYILQRAGPDGEIEQELSAIDTLCGRLIDYFRERGCRIVVLSEYGITPVQRAVHPNRILRDAGFVALKIDLGREYMDFGRCRAFAVADHQVAHIYVRRSEDIDAVHDTLADCPGVGMILDRQGKKHFQLDHERSGDLILVSDPDTWFTYYYWTEDEKAPDFARTVNIHAKPGYDPCELFIDPKITFPRLKIARTLLKKHLGFRYLMDMIPLDAGLVRGSHGRITERTDDGPVFMTSEPKFVNASAIQATDICRTLLDHVFRD